MAWNWIHVAGAVAGITTLIALILTAFTWPNHELAPRDLPLAVVGPEQAVAGLEQGAAGALGDGAFAFERLESRTAAVAATEDREVYGGFVLSPEGVEVLTAPAASPAVASMLAEAATGLAAPRAPAPTVTEVVPLSEDDPRGAVFNSGALPLVIGGIAAGAVLSLQLRHRGARLAGALGVAGASGLVLGGLLQGWLGALDGSYWANAGVIALGIAAIALAVAGLHALLGTPGIGLATLTMVLLGNPLGGVTSAPELLPLGWLGQLLPPGATGTALRSTSYFDGAGAGAPLLVLTVWALAGAALLLLPAREASPSASPVDREDPQASNEDVPAG
jgi:hypothetical protein